jgi:sugar transferase (PEP-CTERM system associated)
MWRYIALRRIEIAFVETFFLACCGLAGYFIHFAEFPSGAVEYIYVLGKALVIAVVFQFSLHLSDVYPFQGRQFSIKFIWMLLLAIGFALLAACLLFLILPWVTIGHGAFTWNLILASLFVFFWHITLRLYLRNRATRTNLLVLGTSKLAIDAVREILKYPELNIKVVGFVAENSDTAAVSDVDVKIIGNYDNFTKLVLEHGVNHIIVGLLDNREKLPIGDLLDFRARGMFIEDAMAFYERMTGKIPVVNLRPSWLVFNSGFDVSTDILRQKRILSILLSVVLLILASPVILLAAIMIKLDSKGPVFYKQKRVGRNGRVFKLVKFRSMRQDAEKETGAVWSGPNDRRVTRVGRFLRRTRIDELPQIYNVLRGDMDMVGPRPERPVFVDQLSKEIPYYPLRHVVKPGISGWAQVNYGYASKLEHTVEKLQYDLFYIKNLSMALDVMIILETIKTVLVRKGS